MSEIKQRVLDGLWERLTQESNQPEQLLEKWVAEVSLWAGLDQYRSSLHNDANLWLPTTDEAELDILLGLAALSSATGYSSTNIVQNLLTEKILSQENQPDRQIEITKPILSEAQTTPNINNNELLIENLTDLQALFELALSKASQQLDSQIFPALELEIYLAEMCDLLRAVLTRETLEP